MGLVGTRCLGLALVLCACRNQPEGQVKVAPTPSRSAAAAALTPSARPEPPPPPWAEALRTERFREAERAFLALPNEAQQSAEVRFAWARARVELGKSSDALPLL